jgi:serine protease Do
VTPALAKEFGLSKPGGALVSGLKPDAPAARAGLKNGDVILELNGQPIESANDLRLRISQTAPGSSVKLEVSRGGKTQNMDVTLAELPPDKSAEQAPGESESGGLDGVDVQELTPDAMQELQLAPGTHGVVVESVDPSSAASSVGLQRGDVIQEVNHQPVRNIAEYKQALAAAGKQPVLLLVNSGGVTHYEVIESR